MCNRPVHTLLSTRLVSIPSFNVRDNATILLLKLYFRYCRCYQVV